MLSLTLGEISEKLSRYGFLDFKFKNGELLSIEQLKLPDEYDADCPRNQFLTEAYVIRYRGLQVKGAETWQFEAEKQYYPKQVDTKHPSQVARAYCARLHSERPSLLNGIVNWTIPEIVVLSNSISESIGHYDYLEMVLPAFWKAVFGKTLEETHNDGIEVAHGDKAYGYRTKWLDAGLSFNRAVMLYLLTYTEKLDCPKHESSAWVIKNYPAYMAMILNAEIEALTAVRKKLML